MGLQSSRSSTVPLVLAAHKISSTETEAQKGQRAFRDLDLTLEG
jgi:hypothetical protein